MMTQSLTSIILLSAFTGMVLFVSNHLSIITALVCMELTSVSMMVLLIMAVKPSMCFILALMIPVVVCEATLGLSLMVSMVRLYGNDMTSNIMSL